MTDHLVGKAEAVNVSACGAEVTRAEFDDLKSDLCRVKEMTTDLHHFLLVEEPQKNGASFVSRLRSLEAWKANVCRAIWIVGGLVITALVGAILKLILA